MRHDRRAFLGTGRRRARGGRDDGPDRPRRRAGREDQAGRAGRARSSSTCRTASRRAGPCAVKDGDAIVPLINKLAGGFEHVVLTQDWHTPGHISFASEPCGEEAVRDHQPALRHPGPLARSLRAGHRRRQLAPGAQDPARRAGDPQGLPQGRGLLLGLHGGGRQDADRAGRLSRASAGLSRCYFVGLATDFCVAWSALDARKAGFEARRDRGRLPRHRRGRLARQGVGGDAGRRG